MHRPHIHFVTGRLAEAALRRMVTELASAAGFDYSIDVLGITVAALMTPRWIARHVHVPPEATRVLIPGYCEGDLAPLEQVAGVPVERGPRDLRRLPEFFGRAVASDYGAYDIEILAEINHAPRMTLEAILAEADRLRADGADLIDLGCDPGEPWSGVGPAVRALRDAGHRVSIDSLNVVEIAAATSAGAELVLSVDSSNRDAAPDWGVEVVAIPDRPDDLASLDTTLGTLTAAGLRFRVDPVLEPIGFGFAQSLGRYLDVRRRYPEAPMMMGIGNLTELTEVDSGAVNALLLGFCQELEIRSVLTTEVINWARTSVRECDVARRLVHYAVTKRSLPKHVDSRLVMLRDPVAPAAHGDEALDRLAAQIKDHSYRLFAENEALHLVTAGLHLREEDPFVLLEKLLATEPRNLDAAHAFYLGYELAKARIALALGKEYRQDESLDWGLLTVPQPKHRSRKNADE